MGRCLGTAPSSVSAVVRDSTPQGKSGMVELVCGPHHVSSGGEKEKFLSGGAIAWASP